MSSQGEGKEPVESQGGKAEQWCSTAVPLAEIRKNSQWKEQCLTLQGGFVCLGEELELLPSLSSGNKEKTELPGWLRVKLHPPKKGQEMPRRMGIILIFLDRVSGPFSLGCFLQIPVFNSHQWTCPL